MDYQIIIAAVSGIGGALLALPIQNKLATAKALESVQKVYSSLNSTLERRVAKLENDLELLAVKRCDKKDCPNRLP